MGAQPEVKPLGRLGKEPVSGAKGPREGEILLSSQVDVDPGPDRIAIAGRSFEPDGDEGVPSREVIPQKPQPRRRTVGDEEIDVSVTIPVDPPDTSPVIA